MATKSSKNLEILDLFTSFREKWNFDFSGAEGVNVRGDNEFLFTPLQAAVLEYERDRENGLMFFQNLIKLGAHPSMNVPYRSQQEKEEYEGASGMNALSFAAMRGNTELCQIICTNKKGEFSFEHVNAPTGTGGLNTFGFLLFQLDSVIPEETKGDARAFEEQRKEHCRKAIIAIASKAKGMGYFPNKPFPNGDLPLGSMVCNDRPEATFILMRLLGGHGVEKFEFSRAGDERKYDLLHFAALHGAHKVVKLVKEKFPAAYQEDMLNAAILASKNVAPQIEQGKIDATIKYLAKDISASPIITQYDETRCQDNFTLIRSDPSCNALVKYIKDNGKLPNDQANPCFGKVHRLAFNVLPDDQCNVPYMQYEYNISKTQIQKVVANVPARFVVASKIDCKNLSVVGQGITNFGNGFEKSFAFHMKDTKFTWACKNDSLIAENLSSSGLLKPFVDGLGGENIHNAIGRYDMASKSVKGANVKTIYSVALREKVTLNNVDVQNDCPLSLAAQRWCLAQELKAKEDARNIIAIVKVLGGESLDTTGAYDKVSLLQGDITEFGYILSHSEDLYKAIERPEIGKLSLASVYFE